MAPTVEDDRCGPDEEVVFVGPSPAADSMCQWISYHGGLDARCIPGPGLGGELAVDAAKASYVAVVVPADQVEAARAYFNPSEEGDEERVQAHLRRAPLDLLRLGLLTGAVLLAVTTAFGFWSRYWPLPACACGLVVAGLVGEGLRRRKRSSQDANATAGKWPDPS